MKSYHILSLLTLLTCCQQASQEESSTDRITFKVFIEKPIDEVFQLYTSQEGLQSFLAPNVKIDFGNDSLFFTCNEVSSDLTEPGHVTNSIISYVEPEMLHFKVRAAPPYLPFANELENLHTIIKFKGNRKGTEVEGTTFGFDKLTNPEDLRRVFSQINTFTFDQLKNHTEGNTISWANLSRPNSPEKRYKEFISDSIWYNTYRFVNNEVVRPMLNEAFNSIEVEYEVGLDNLSMFYFTITNFDKSGFTAKAFSSRYPFVKQDFASSQLDVLVEKGLLINTDGSYTYTQNGNNMATLIVEKVSGLEVPILNSKELDNIIKAFSGVAAEALSEAYSFRFPSLVQKKNSLISNSDNKVVKLVILMDDMIAIRNDASHYSYKNLKPYRADLKELEPQSQEIFGYANRSSFSISSFSERRTWGFDSSETKMYMERLVSAGLANWKNDSTIMGSIKGKELAKDLSIISEKVFYTPWLCLSPDKYAQMKEVILR